MRHSFHAVALAALLLIPNALAAEEATAGSIAVENAWSRATPAGAAVGAGYLTIKNDGSAPDRLMAASAAIAGQTEIHQMSMEGGVMKMRRLPDGLTVPAKGSVTLDPNGYHLMFMQLKGPLKEGEDFKGSLTFEHAGTLDVTFHVQGMGTMSPDASGHDH
jgi:periplasmic copper chaperone A